MSLLDALIAQGVKNNAEFTKALIAIKERVGNTPEKLAISDLQSSTSAMQDVDDFTLMQSLNTTQDTQAMKDVDDFTLQQVFGIDERLTAVENKVNGGTL